MAKPKADKPAAIDRFQTGKSYFSDDLQRLLREHAVGGVKGGSTVGLALLCLWMHCDRAGTVVMPVDRLARHLSCKWDTAKRAISILAGMRLIVPAERKDGTPIPHKWVVVHLDKTEDGK